MNVVASQDRAAAESRKSALHTFSESIVCRRLGSKLGHVHLYQDSIHIRFTIGHGKNRFAKFCDNMEHLNKH